MNFHHFWLFPPSLTATSKDLRGIPQACVPERMSGLTDQDQLGSLVVCGQQGIPEKRKTLDRWSRVGDENMDLWLFLRFFGFWDSHIGRLMAVFLFFLESFNYGMDDHKPSSFLVTSSRVATIDPDPQFIISHCYIGCKTPSSPTTGGAYWTLHQSSHHPIPILPWNRWIPCSEPYHAHTPVQRFDLGGRMSWSHWIWWDFILEVHEVIQSREFDSNILRFKVITPEDPSSE